MIQNSGHQRENRVLSVKHTVELFRDVK